MKLYQTLSYYQMESRFSIAKSFKQFMFESFMNLKTTNQDACFVLIELQWNTIKQSIANQIQQYTRYDFNFILRSSFHQNTLWSQKNWSWKQKEGEWWKKAPLRKYYKETTNLRMQNSFWFICMYWGNSSVWRSFKVIMSLLLDSNTH